MSEAREIAGSAAFAPPAEIASRSCISAGTLCAVLLLAATLPYAGTLANGFVYDDNTQVLNNPYVQGFGHLEEMFTTNVWSYVGAQGVTNYYRPMMTLSYLVTFQLFGPLAYAFHLANLLLHVAVVLVLFVLTQQIFRDRLLAFIAALIFALHPIHTESVAWIAAVTDLQLAFFYLLTFWFFVRAAGPRGSRSSAMLLGMALAFPLALMSKEPAMTLPVLAVAYEHCFREDRAETSLGQKLGRYYLLWLVAFGYLIFRVRFFGAVAPVLQISDLTWGETMLSAVALAGQYIWKLLWPVELCAFYVFERSTSLGDPRVLAGLGSLAALLILFVILWKRARPLSFAILWFAVTLAPVLNPRWLAANVFTERYLYLPSVAFCWLVAGFWVSLFRGAEERQALWRRALVGGLALLSVLYAVRIVTRIPDWRDDVTLYTKTLEVSPASYHIRNNLGTVYWKRGDIAAAEREWQRAHELVPRNSIILNNLGLIDTQRKDYDRAREYFWRAMRLKPNYTDPHLNLGVAYLEQGQHDQAELQLRAAVALSPLNVYARRKISELYVETGRLKEAEENYRRAVESQPDLFAYKGLGRVYRMQNRPEDAQKALLRARELDPFDSEVRFQLAELHLASGRTAEALSEYRAGLETDPRNAEALEMVRKLSESEPSVD